jgi:outer membrane protein TolC
VRAKCSSLTRLFCLVLISVSVAKGQVPAPAPDSAASVETSGFSKGFLGSLSLGPSTFPHVWNPYLQRSLPHPVLLNSPRLSTLIHDGKLELSMADALALTLENNLDIVVQRYVMPFAQTDVLRSKSGQAARGFTGALYPSELNSGAIGAGVTNAGGTGGTGNAGGITGGGGAVNVGAAGAFDPTVSFAASYDRVTSPLNSLVVSGLATTTSSAIAYSASYAQLFTTGASYSVSLSTLRQITTQKNTLYNPDVTSRLSIGFNQPLLAGFGRGPNTRFMVVAKNDLGTAQEVFKQQVITSVAQLEDAYYNLAAFQLNVQVAQESLAAVKELLNQTKKEEEIGVLSRVDVETVESQAAASERDLILAQTNLQQQETTLKQLISKRNDPDLDAAAIVLSDQLPEPRESDLPDLRGALTTALANRPELKEAQNNLQNQNIAIKYAQNNLLPSLAVFGLYAGSGLQGNTITTTPAGGTATTATSGALGSLGQSFGGTFPEGAYGVSFATSIRNRSAQADNMRAQLERNQQEISQQNTKNQINLQVQQSRVGLIQGRAQVEAAHEAVRLAQVSLDAERERLQNGISTAYNVILKERDYVTAQYAEVQVASAYAAALVAMDQATGTTLEKNGIDLNDALTGTVATKPTPPFRLPAVTPTQRGVK